MAKTSSDDTTKTDGAHSGSERNMKFRESQLDTISADNVELRQCNANSITAKTIKMEQSAGIFLAAEKVESKNSATLLLVAQEVHGDVRPIFSLPAALVIAGAIIFGMSLFRNK